MEEILLTKEENFVPNCKIVDVSPNKKYQVSAEIRGIKGEKYSAYFGVIIQNEIGEEMTRKIKWLNDFSNTKNILTLVVSVPDYGKKMVVIYRINHETPLKSDCHFFLSDPNEIKIVEATSQQKESFDSLGDYKVTLGKELSKYEEDILEKNLVWLFSYARSGTSWLAGKLLSHNTLFLNEPLIGMHLGMFAPVFLTGKLIRNYDFFKDEPNYFFSDRFSNIWKFHLRKFILNRVNSQFNDLSKKIIIKEPNGSFAADILSQCFPNSKIIIMIRDGRDVIDSKVDSFKEGAWGSKGGTFSIPKNKRENFVAFHAKSWIKQADLLNQTYNSHSNEFRFKLNYEDLLSNTYQNLKNLYEFIGIKIDEGDLEKIVEKSSFKNVPQNEKGGGKVVRSASPGDWKKNLTEKEHEIMMAIMGDALKKMGYEI